MLQHPFEKKLLKYVIKKYDAHARMKFTWCDTGKRVQWRSVSFTVAEETAKLSHDFPTKSLQKTKCTFIHDAYSDAGDASGTQDRERALCCCHLVAAPPDIEMNAFGRDLVSLTSCPGRWSTLRRPRSAQRRAPRPSSAPPVWIVRRGSRRIGRSSIRARPPPRLCRQLDHRGVDSSSPRSRTTNDYKRDCTHRHEEQVTFWTGLDRVLMTGQTKLRGCHAWKITSAGGWWYKGRNDRFCRWQRWCWCCTVTQSARMLHPDEGKCEALSGVLSSSQWPEI